MVQPVACADAATWRPLTLPIMGSAACIVCLLHSRLSTVASLHRDNGLHIWIKHVIMSAALAIVICTTSLLFAICRG
jgi:hypothetical protein